MPKDRTNKRRSHESPVKLNNRQFTDHGHIRHAEIKGVEASDPQAESYGTEELSVASTSMKKEKYHSKEAFLQRHGPESSLPYSKSHGRRLRRKAKEQIIGGNLKDLQTAIAALDDNYDEAPESHASVDNVTPSPSTSTLKSRPKPGKIGEGKKNPLSRSQRKRALVLEQLRQPLILSNPEFSSNPFQTLRTHAQNTLSKHHIPV